MALSLSEYAARHPQAQPEPEREQTAATADIIRELQQEKQAAEDLKASITRQLEKGEPPQAVLYTAIQAIGILSRDAAWADAAKAALDSVWADLSQQSLFLNTDEAAAARLQEQQREYSAKLQRQLKRQLDKIRQLEQALRAALAAAEGVDVETL